MDIRPGRTLRTGATITELLIVILVMLAVTATTIPAIAPAMKGRRVREGARMVSVFVNAARNRAMQSGRPTGVWIERMPGEPEAAITLHFCEQPPAYSGDFDDSRVKMFVHPGGEGVYPGQVHGNQAAPNEVVHWIIVQPWATYAPDLDTWADAEPGKQYMVQEGDRIKVNNQSTLFTLRRRFFPDLESGRWAWYIGTGVNGRYNHNGSFTDRGIRDWNWNYVIRWYYGVREINGDDDPIVTGNGLQDYENYYRGVTYRIIRRPKKLAAGAIQLPEGVIIDLNYSGLSGYRLTDPGVPFHPRRDPDDSPTAPSPYRGSSVFPDDQTPVIMLMSPDGSVAELYHWTTDGKGNFNWGVAEPFGQIYFLIGQRSKVPASVERTVESQLKNNWVDMNNVWVTVNAQTGLVTTTELNDFLDLTDKITPDPHNVHRTRDLAERAQSMGGR